MQARIARPSGMTLLELLLALAIGASLVAIAIPAWSSASEGVHAAAAQAALFETLLGAVNHATVTGAEVVLCPGDASGCRDSVDWSRGWVAWADLDGDRAHDPGETVLHAEPALPGSVHLRSTSGRRRLVFQPNGGNAGSNVTFTLCDGRGAGRARALILANDGRLHASPATSAAASACMQTL